MNARDRVIDADGAGASTTHMSDPNPGLDPAPDREPVASGASGPMRRSPRRTVRTRPTRVRTIAAVWFAGALGIAMPAVAFELSTVALEDTTLDAYVGDDRWTIVMLWTTDCVPCEAQKPMLEAFHRDHEDGDARVVGVALDGLALRDEVLAINARHATSYPVLLADESRFRPDYEALVGSPLRATPTYLLYDRDGAFVAAHTGPVARSALDQAVVPR